MTSFPAGVRTSVKNADVSVSKYEKRPNFVKNEYFSMIFSAKYSYKSLVSKKVSYDGV